MQHGGRWEMVRAPAAYIIGLVLSLLGASAPARSQTAEAFYAGRALDLVVGFPPGGSNDVYARHVARHMSRHIPGNPRIISRNMPGAGGLAAANWLYAQAAKDGTVIGLAAPACRSTRSSARQISASKRRSSNGSAASRPRLTSFSFGTRRRPPRSRMRSIVRSRSAPPARAPPCRSTPTCSTSCLAPS